MVQRGRIFLDDCFAGKSGRSPPDGLAGRLHLTGDTALMPLIIKIGSFLQGVSQLLVVFNPKGGTRFLKQVLHAIH